MHANPFTQNALTWRAATCRNRVVFPAPLCPTRSTLSPRLPVHCSMKAAVLALMAGQNIDWTLDIGRDTETPPQNFRGLSNNIEKL